MPILTCVCECFLWTIALNIYELYGGEKLLSSVLTWIILWLQRFVPYGFFWLKTDLQGNEEDEQSKWSKNNERKKPRCNVNNRNKMNKTTTAARNKNEKAGYYSYNRNKERAPLCVVSVRSLVVFLFVCRWFVFIIFQFLRCIKTAHNQCLSFSFRSQPLSYAYRKKRTERCRITMIQLTRSLRLSYPAQTMELFFSLIFRVQVQTEFGSLASDFTSSLPKLNCWFIDIFFVFLCMNSTRYCFKNSSVVNPIDWIWIICPCFPTLSPTNPNSHRLINNNHSNAQWKAHRMPPIYLYVLQNFSITYHYFQLLLFVLCRFVSCFFSKRL